MAGSFARYRIEAMSLSLEGLEGVKQALDAVAELADKDIDLPLHKAVMVASYGIECFGTMFHEELKNLAENLDGLEARAGVSEETTECDLVKVEKSKAEKVA